MGRLSAFAPSGSGGGIRTDLRPGDISEIARLHALLYAAEYGLDVTFEAGVAAGLAEAAARGWPGPREGVWIVEGEDRRMAGAVGLTDGGAGSGRVRWFLLAPESRGRGLGRRLLSAVLARACEAGYRRLELTTFSELAAAAHLYRDAGFVRVSAEPQRLWGRELVLERYELLLSASPDSDVARPAGGG